VAIALVGAAGFAIERTRYGASPEEAVARVEAEVRVRIGSSADTLDGIASGVLASAALVAEATRDPAIAGALFDLLDAHVPESLRSSVGATILGPTGRPLAWTGRVSDIPDAERAGSSALLVLAGPLGPRLVRVETIADSERAIRVGSVVVEAILADLERRPGLTAPSAFTTTLAPVTLTVGSGNTGGQALHTFTVLSEDGRDLASAHVDPRDLEAGRSTWRRRVAGAMVALAGLTLVMMAAPLVDAHRASRTLGRGLAVAGLLVLTLGVGCGLVLSAASRLLDEPGSVRAAVMAVSAAFSAAAVWTAFDLLERWRMTRPRRRLAGGPAAYAGAGVLSASLLWGYVGVLERRLAGPATDLFRFALDPAEVPRVATAAALLVLHAAFVWAAALPIRGVEVASRRRPPYPAPGAAFWGAGVLAATLGLSRLPATVPVAPLYVSLAAAGACAWTLGRPRPRARRASQAARLGVLLAAFLAPALSIYPMLHALSTRATEQVVADGYGPRAVHLREDLQNSLRSALEAIDGMPSLGTLVPDPGDGPATTDQAFRLWSTTDLARQRLTSAVELYAADGRLASRFALNLPEYAAATHVAVSCEWDLFDEVSPFGSSERHVLRASRGICEDNRRLGTVVVRAMLDYRTLPFIASESPYIESLRSSGGAGEVMSARPDVEFVVYGWSRAPIYVSGTSVWSVPDAIFDRMVASRDPEWAGVRRGSQLLRVLFLNDRGGIYALGYPVTTPFGHLVNLAELATLAGIVFMLIVGGGTAFNLLTVRTPASGRALWREVRSSFYRKLFLALLAAAVVPVVVLAVATRTYFAAQFRSGIEESAMQTATVAQRLVQDYATLQEQGGGLEGLDDQLMVLVARAIDQAVNLFDRDRLQATSERDLFASGLLPARTPAAVYRAIVVDRLPAFVGEEEVGGLPYLVAAAPARAGTRAGIVTVPQTLRRQQIEQQIDELDRRVLFASVLFVLMGAGIGYWMAERIADPVRRLTRATRRIALGDLDARIAATSSDELRRLVEDFNQMAADLKRQRRELERTQRLEAWAEMARQVAHDIKNPLTPIQLAAEHARRVNQDRGRPLSPVLDECIDAILGQVRLLRQISAEFSSFASSPTPRPERTDLAAIVGEVLAPYRTALHGRVAVEIRTPADLPPVRLDRTLFARALTNVVENAIHAMPGGGRLAIEASPIPPGFVAVTVADSGVGMDDESVARIFEPYFSTKATGTGLGLTIAKRNVELNGGTIAIASRPGHGTTVTMTVPVFAS
jgi:signal transduction histidine kinase